MHAASARRRALFHVLAIGGVCLLGGSLFAGVCVGTTSIPLEQIARVLATRLLPLGDTAPEGVREVDASIVWLVRVPRALLAALVGGMLAVAGALLQGLFRNPLAAPGIVGVSQGAALGAVIALVSGLGIRYQLAMPAFAFAGAFLALLVILGLAFRGGGTSIATLLLAGVALNFLLSAGISLLVSLSFKRHQVATEIMTWLMGGLEGRSWLHVQILLPCAILALALAQWFARDLDLMLEGETSARALGVATERVKLAVLAVTALLVGAAVATSGVIGFVGLVVPHIVRLLVGPGHRALVPLSGLTGAWFLVLADLLARTLIRPEEVQLGIVTACIGAPFFLFLLLRNRKEAALL